MLHPRTPAALGMAVLLGLGAAFAPPLSAATDDLAEARSWIERFESSDASTEEVRAARAQLVKIASGVVEDPATREASFALARSEGSGVQEIMAATSLFPDDSRTPDLLAVLARKQTEAGDPYGALIAYKQLLEDPARATPQLLTQASDIAARAGDMAKAFEWSQRVDPDELSPMNAYRLHVARLKSGAALLRTDIALESAAILGEGGLDTLKLDPQALLAAAQVHEAAEQTDKALAQYETFVNIHTSSPHRPQALLAFGLLLTRTGKVEHAKRVYRWAILEHQGTEAADFARVELLEVDGRPTSSDRIASYLEAARLASSGESASAILDRLIERYLAAGLPFEAFTALAGLAHDGMGNETAAAVAGQKLEASLEPVLKLLASRDDHVSVAAVAALATKLGVPIQRGQFQAVQSARHHLGLPRLRFGALAEAITLARDEMKNESWFTALGLLEGALHQDRSPWAPDVAQARKMMAECYWRLGKDSEALIEVKSALESAFDLPTIRKMRVLRADILFSSGNVATACDEYNEARALGVTPWVTDQLGRCAVLAAKENSG